MQAGRGADPGAARRPTQPQRRSRTRRCETVIECVSNALDPALLIDYQGGKGWQDRVETRTADNKPKSTLAIDSVPVQMLILTPEGKLMVRNYQDDNGNEERAARLKAWKEWIADVQSGRRKPKPGAASSCWARSSRSHSCR